MQKDMNLKLKSIALILCLFAFSAMIWSQDYYRIRNNWQGTYLYESGDQVLYGNPAANDTSSQWSLEDVDGTWTRIRNRSTGQYMNIESQLDWVECTSTDTGWWSAQWELVAIDGTWVNLRNRWYTDRFIHIENLNGWAECWVIDTVWTSAHWSFVTVSGTATSTPTPAPANTPTPTTPPSGGLPAPWANSDVGSVGAAGSCTYSNGVFTVEGSGADIWNSADEFQYVHQQVSGDVTVTARVTSVENTNSWAKSGVMIRETLTNSSTHAYMAFTAGNGPAFQRRTTTGGSSAHTAGSGSAPIYVRVTRSGNSFTGYTSTNGTSWTQVGNVSISMSTIVYAGLAVTSHSDGTLCTAVLDNVSVTGANVSTATPAPANTNSPAQTAASTATPTRTPASTVTPTQTTAGTSSPTSPQTQFDRTDPGGTITAEYNDSPSGEEMDKAFDNLSSTKYLTFHSSGWIQFRFSGGNTYTINSYTITSANDAPERDPLSWTVYGSNNGSTWTAIDSRSGQDFANRFQTNSYTCSNSNPYGYIRLDFNNNSGSILQFAEIELFGNPGGTVTPANTATPTATTANTSTPTPTDPSSNQSPYLGSPSAINNGAVIQAENYDEGGSNIACYDTTSGNTGGAYRSDDVDLESCGDSGGGYNVGWIIEGEWLEYTVNVTGGTYNVTARVASAGSTIGDLRMLLDGSSLGTFSVGSTGAWQTYTSITLNNITFTGGNNKIFRLEAINGGDFNINYLSFTSSGTSTTSTPTRTAAASTSTPTPTSITSGRGATVPWTEYEAENCSTNGTVLGPSATRGDIPAEAQGRMCVRLDANGEYVQFTSSNSANAIVIRYCMPDSSGGGGIDATLSLYVNGSERTNLNLTSRYAWIYEPWPWTNTPGGTSHKMFDETRALLGFTITSGDTVRLQKDSGDTAAYYIIDLVDLLTVGSPISKPSGYISVTDYGAVPNDNGDDFAGFDSCISTAYNTGQGVWIPEGNYIINTETMIGVPGNVSMRGAGMWYSVLGGKYPNFYITGSNVTFRDFAVMGTSTFREDSLPASFINGPIGSGSVIENIWIQHMKCAGWPEGANGLTIRNCFVKDLYADGFNLYNGTSNTVIENCHIRGTGDDSIAMWTSTSQGSNNIIRKNTVVMPILANAVALYGGYNTLVEDNVMMGTMINGGGVLISSNFTSQPFSGTTTVRRNTIISGGGNSDWGSPTGGIRIWACEQNISGLYISENDILNSATAGITICGPFAISNSIFSNITINGAGTYGIYVEATSQGSMTFEYVTVSGASSGSLRNDAGAFTIIRGSGNSGW
ncbi:MAG: carbohydrate-binding protein [Spirochaetales bacterium]|nr:carbohydrate-binding protein [Spirochaetales bacterium]